MIENQKDKYHQKKYNNMLKVKKYYHLKFLQKLDKILNNYLKK